MQTLLYVRTDLCTLAVIKGNEDYEHLAVVFKDNFHEINEIIATPTIGGVQYTLEFFLSADDKVLLQW